MKGENRKQPGGRTLVSEPKGPALAERLGGGWPTWIGLTSSLYQLSALLQPPLDGLARLAWRHGSGTKPAGR